LGNIFAEVEIVQEKPPLQSSRNGPSRQRRRERRAAARAEAEAATVAAEDAVATEAEAAQTEKASKEVDLKVSVNETESSNFKDAVEATELEAAKAFEPVDEIANEKITDAKSEQICSAVSIIPTRRVNANDEAIGKVIKEKLDEKGVQVQEVYIHRSENGIFTRCDARIGPVPGRLIEETEFGFQNCRVLPMF
jgi:hypothetical protein